MNSSLTKNFDGHNVRVVGTPENPLFVAADVCAMTIAIIYFMAR